MRAYCKNYVTYVNLVVGFIEKCRRGCLGRGGVNPLIPDINHYVLNTVPTYLQCFM